MKNARRVSGAVVVRSWLLMSTLSACGADELPAPWVPELTSGAGTTASAGASGAAGAAGQSSAGKSGAAGGSGATGGQPAPTELSAWCGVKQTLTARCTSCHNEQKVAGAPMSLLTYADLQAPAPSDSTKKVYQTVGTRVHDTVKPMPPQQQLTAAQLGDIDTWVAAGAPMGADATCDGVSAPPTQQAWPEHCDAVYKILAHGEGGPSAPFVVPAGQEIHPKVAVTAPWGSDALQGIAFRSVTNNPRVLHHWILYGPKREFLVGWAPGKDDVPMPRDVGMNLAGGELTLDMHYNNLLGKTDEQDNSGVEICALTKDNFRKYTAAVHMGFTQLLFTIPAHATGYDVTGQCTVSSTAPVTVFSASPHAHTLATHMKFSVKKADGEVIVMHDDDFDFSEQQAFALKVPVVLEAGDKVITTCTYNNPSDHAVTFGENTGNEMCFNFAAYYPMDALKCGRLFTGR